MSGTHQIALCTRRTMPVGRRQDGWNYLPAEARFDLVAMVKIKSIETEVVEYNGKYYSYLEEKFSGCDIFLQVGFEKIEDTTPKKHRFGLPLTSHGNTCAACGIHSQSTEADKDCPGSD